MVIPLSEYTHGLDLKGNSNFELGTAICYVNVENYFLTIIKHLAVPSSKLEFPLIIFYFREERRKEKIKKRLQTSDQTSSEEREKKKLKYVYKKNAGKLNVLRRMPLH